MIVNNNKPSNTSFQARVISRGNVLGKNEMSSAITEIRKLAAAIPHSETDTITLAAQSAGRSGKTDGILGYYMDVDGLDERIAGEYIEPESHQLTPTVEQWITAAKKLIQSATENKPKE